MGFGRKELESFYRLDCLFSADHHTLICIIQRFTVTYSFVMLLFEYSVLLCSQAVHQEPDLRHMPSSTSLSSVHVILMEQNTCNIFLHRCFVRNDYFFFYILPWKEDEIPISVGTDKRESGNINKEKLKEAVI